MLALGDADGLRIGKTAMPRQQIKAVHSGIMTETAKKCAGATAAVCLSIVTDARSIDLVLPTEAKRDYLHGVLCEWSGVQPRAARTAAAGAGSLM